MLDSMTPQEADTEYKNTLRSLAEEYGGYSFIPSESWREASEITRAWAVVAKYEGTVSVELLGRYMVPLSIITRIMPSVTLDNTRKVARADQYKAFEQWARDHDREQFTTDQIVEASGFGYQTTLKFIDGHPSFYKIKKGLYECRDCDTERKQAKKSK